MRSSAHYLFRLDDVCPTLKWSRFTELITLFEKHHITPILGLVPDNQDPKLVHEAPRAEYWPTITRLVQQGWIPAQHGWQHQYETNDSGLLRLRQRSEFAGLSYEIQLEKISAGKKILEQKLGRTVTWWTAPAHSFDTVTCQVLRELTFTHISDGIALWPFERLGLTWIPHQLWQPAWRPFGVWTVGIHLNTMSDQLVTRLTSFLEQNATACRNVSLEPRQHILNNPYRHLWYMNFWTQRYLSKKLPATS